MYAIKKILPTHCCDVFVCWSLCFSTACCWAQMTVRIREAAERAIATANASNTASAHAEMKLGSALEGIQDWARRRSLVLSISRCRRTKVRCLSMWKVAAAGRRQNVVRAGNLRCRVFLKLQFRSLVFWREVLLNSFFYSSRLTVSICHRTASWRRRCVCILLSWRRRVQDTAIEASTGSTGSTAAHEARQA